MRTGKIESERAVTFDDGSEGFVGRSMGLEKVGEERRPWSWVGGKKRRRQGFEGLYFMRTVVCVSRCPGLRMPAGLRCRSTTKGEGKASVVFVLASSFLFFSKS